MATLQVRKYSSENLQNLPNALQLGGTELLFEHRLYQNPHSDKCNATVPIKV